MSTPDTHRNPEARTLALLVIVPLLLLPVCFLVIWALQVWGPDDGDRFNQAIGLLFGITVLLLAAVQGLSLAIPRLGRWTLGSHWPGHFEDAVRKRLAMRAVLLQVSGTALFSISFLLRAIPDSLGYNSLLPPARLVLAFAAIACFFAARRMSGEP